MLVLRPLYPKFQSDATKPTSAEVGRHRPRALGLAAYWLIGSNDEAGGSSIKELISKVEVPFQNGPTWVSDAEGLVLNIQSANNSAAIINTVFNQYGGTSTSGMTTACRVKFDSFNPGQWNGTYPIRINDGDGDNFAMGVGAEQVDTGGTMNFQYFCQFTLGSPGMEILAGSPSVNVWYTIVGVTDGTASHKLYVDGVQQGATNTTDLTAVASAWTRTNFGGHTPIEMMNGSISWIGMWNRALSLNEIKDLNVRPYAHLKPRYLRSVVQPPTVTARTKTATFDAVLSIGRTKTATFDAYLNIGRTKTAAYDAVLGSGRTKTVTYDSVLVAPVGRTKTCTFDAYLTPPPNRKSCTFDAILASFEVAQEGRYFILPGRPRTFTLPSTN